MAPALIVNESPTNSTINKTKLATYNEAKTLKAALQNAEARFTARNPRSLELHQEAVKSLPGGNTRSLLHTSPFPVHMKSGKDYQVVSEDGHTYTDFVGELTAGLYGHSNPVILSSLQDTLSKVGLNLGATTQSESRYAALLCSRFAIDRIRFCNSGTEANLHALAAARKFTGRRKIVVFTGGYHGAVLSFPDEVAENNVDRGDWVLATYNDTVSVQRILQEQGTEVAAVLVEAMQGAGGGIPARKEFLLKCQEAAHEVGALFMLDEVMTSRLAPHGLGDKLGLTPDLKTFGKYLGGGLAFGAFGGREEVMAVYDPRREGALSHSGTFNNNTLAMYAGFAGLSQVYTPETCRTFTAKGDEFRQQLNEVVKGTKVCFTGVGTIMALHIAQHKNVIEADVVSKDSVTEDWDMKDLFWYEMMEEGFWITRRGSFALMLGTPEAELERFVRVVGKWVKDHETLLKA